MTDAQRLLQMHLKEIGVDTVPEFRFAPSRRFRFDLYSERLRMGFECNGAFKGKHGTGWDGGHDYEKICLAQMLGYRIMLFTNRAVETGKAKEFLSEWLETIQ